MSDVSAVRARIDAQRRRQRLLPIGKPGASQRWKPRGSRTGLAKLVGYSLALAATVGGMILTSAPTTSVAMSPTAYRIGDTTLRASAAGTFTGPGALIVVPAGGGIDRAAADVTVDGKRETGVCFVSPAQSQERCIFVINSGSVSAVDTWTGNGWSRHYDDGQEVNIPATHLAPVPFAVGR